MSNETQKIVEILDQRLAAMNAVAESLTLAGAAIAACNIDELESRIREQESLCLRIQDLDRQLDATQKRRTSLASAATSTSENLGIAQDNQRQLSAAMERVREVHDRVKRLNANHAELLRRSRRTVQALTQAYHSVSLGTYADPLQQSTVAGERV